MDSLLPIRPPLRNLGGLFAEDFDRPEPAAEPQVVEPTFSAADLANARTAAWDEGHAAGLSELADAEQAETRQALHAIAEAFAAERDAAALRQQELAETIARLLFDSLAKLFPKLCARYGEAELCAVVRTVMPGLAQEPAIAIRVHPRMATVLAQELNRLDPDISARVEVVTCDAMPPGDIRITWRNGSATRDASALWEQVAAVLMPAGLLSATAAIKETVDGN